jgi:hypothetical protein
MFCRRAYCREGKVSSRRVAPRLRHCPMPKLQHPGGANNDIKNVGTKLPSRLLSAHSNAKQSWNCPGPEPSAMSRMIFDNHILGRPPHPARGVYPEPLRCAQGRSQQKGERARHPLPQGQGGERLSRIDSSGQRSSALSRLSAFEASFNERTAAGAVAQALWLREGAKKSACPGKPLRTKEH